MKDAALLARLLQEDGLSSFERRAFADMQQTGLAKYGSLTHAQRAWAQRVGARIGLPLAAVEPTPMRSAWEPEKREAPVMSTPKAKRCPLCKHRIALHHVDGRRVPCRWQDGRQRCGCRGRYRNGKGAKV